MLYSLTGDRTSVSFILKLEFNFAVEEEHMDLTILKDIVIIFALSTIVNFLFTKIKVPTIIGYMLTGIIAGPHLLGIISSSHEIELMAEIGVVLLMFTIGLEFSLKQLVKIRKTVFFGGLLQLLLTAFITFLIAHAYDMDWKGALLVGFLTALSSTAVVLKLLQERSELTSNYGRTVLGVLIFQDLILIPLLLFTPVLGGGESDLSKQLFILMLKALVIIGFVYVGNKWLMPKLLHFIALTKNQELFFMSILFCCFAVALLTSELGMSLAFGAFLAGLMISGSEYSHNAFGNLIPFKDTFTSFFFVSIGMLLDLNFILENYILVSLTVLLVIAVKTFIAGGTAFILGHTFRGTVMVGLALSQVGEFSFILARLGLNYEIISNYYYQLFLSVAIITMSVSPFLIHIAKPFAEMLLKLPLPQFLVDGLFPLKQIEIPELENHLVLIGKDSRALNLSLMVKFMNLPYVSIIFDPATVHKLQQKGETVIYGDAVNEPILKKGHVHTADIVVISVGEIITTMAILNKVRQMNPRAFIIVRARVVDDIEELYKLGANQVIPEEFETAIELFKRILKKILVPRKEIEVAVAKIRDENYGIFREEEEDFKLNVLKDLPNIEIVALTIDEQSFLVNKALFTLKFRKNYGVSLVALKRDNRIIDHPVKDIVFQTGDIAYILGTPEQIAKAVELFSKESEEI